MKRSNLLLQEAKEQSEFPFQILNKDVFKCGWGWEKGTPIPVELLYEIRLELLKALGWTSTCQKL